MTTQLKEPPKVFSEPLNVIHEPPKSMRPKAQKRTSDAEQLRKDRITAVIVLLILAALFGLVIWLGAISGPMDVPHDYWTPM